MPDDTDGPYDHSPSQERIREINKGLQKLSCKSPSPHNNRLETIFLPHSGYVERKAAQQPENAVVDFVHTEKACRLLFSKYVAAKKSGVSPINALPNLLDVVSNAEAYRLSIAHQADLAVNTWNVYFKSTEPKQALSKQDVEALNGIVESQAQWRKVYLKIVEKAIALVCHYFRLSLKHDGQPNLVGFTLPLCLKTLVLGRLHGQATRIQSLNIRTHLWTSTVSPQFYQLSL